MKSTGTWADARTVVSKDLVDWADLIFVMENHHKEALIKIGKELRKIIDLGFDGHYLKGDPELTSSEGKTVRISCKSNRVQLKERRGKGETAGDSRLGSSSLTFTFRTKL